MDSVEAWLPLLKDSDPRERARALEALVQIDRERAQDAFEEALHDPSPLIRACVARLAPSFPSSVAAELLGVLLQDLDGEVRIRALRGLSEIGDPGLPVLRAQLLRELDPKVLATLLQALAPQAELEDIPRLEAQLGHPDPRVRANAVEALDSVFSRRWSQALAAVRQDPNNRVQGNVLRSLARIDPEDALLMIAEMGQHPETPFRISGAWAAGRSGRYEILRETLGLLKDSDPQVRLQALRALSSQPRFAWRDEVRECLSQEDDPMVLELAQGLFP